MKGCGIPDWVYVPIATQLATLEQDTLVNDGSPVAPGGAAKAAGVHVEPCKISANGPFVPDTFELYWPTATHDVGEAQEIPSSAVKSAPLTAGTPPGDQTEPDSVETQLL